MNTLDKFNLKNTLAIITGGAGLLGRQHTEALLDAGSNVIVLDNSNKNIKSLETSLGSHNNLHTFKIDITDEKALLKLKNTIKKRFHNYPSVLINNAAIDPKVSGDNVKSGSFESFKIDTLYQEISVGLVGAVICTKIFGNEMAKNKGGVILNISSDLGLIAPNQEIYENSYKPVSYSIIKHGIIGLTKYTSTYWAKQGVRCNALAPGGMKNDQSDKFISKIEKLIPMNRMANQDEYKATIVYMCSDASSYMNGAVVAIDGGRTSW